jgi:hypothetical protein
MDKDIRGDMSFEEWTEAGETLPCLDCEALEAVSTHGRSPVPILMADVLVSWGGCVNAAQGAIGLQSHWRRADLSSRKRLLTNKANGVARVIKWQLLV